MILLSKMQRQRTSSRDTDQSRLQHKQVHLIVRHHALPRAARSGYGFHHHRLRPPHSPQARGRRGRELQIHRQTGCSKDSRTQTRWPNRTCERPRQVSQDWGDCTSGGQGSGSQGKSFPTLCMSYDGHANGGKLRRQLPMMAPSQQTLSSTMQNISSRSLLAARR